MPQGQYSNNPAKITVDYLLKNPQVLQRRFAEQINARGFISEALLQGGADVRGGAVAYNRTNPQMPDEEGGRRGYEIIAEGARFPIIGPLEPQEEVARSAKHGLRMFVTEEMKIRNQLPQFDRRLKELKNELIVYVDSVFMARFTSDPFITGNFMGVTGGAWSASNGYIGTSNQLNMNIMRDIESAKNRMYAMRKGIQPDTLIVHDNVRLELLTHPVTSAMLDKGETSSPFFTGQLPNKLAGLDVLFTPFIDQDRAYVLQKKAIGGYGDERPTQLNGPAYDPETEIYWFKGSRMMIAYIDAPEACVEIRGVADGTP